MIERRLAVSFDFDGVLFPRIPAQSAALKPWENNIPLKLKHNGPIFMTERIPSDHPLSSYEQAEVRRHAKRAVKPEVIELVRRIQTAIIIGNTGRPNNTATVALTFDRLQQAGIRDKFDHIAFTPSGVGAEESKYWALLELIRMGYRITHYDDNARTVRRLAKALPCARFVIVQDLTSGFLFSRKEMKKYPNVTRIAKLKI